MVTEPTTQYMMSTSQEYHNLLKKKQGRVETKMFNLITPVKILKEIINMKYLRTEMLADCQGSVKVPLCNPWSILKLGKQLFCSFVQHTSDRVNCLSIYSGLGLVFGANGRVF